MLLRRWHLPNDRAWSLFERDILMQPRSTKQIDNRKWHLTLRSRASGANICFIPSVFSEIDAAYSTL